MKKLNADHLRHLLNYNPETGDFRWNRKAMSRRPGSDVAGAVTTGGYIQIQIDGCIYKAHRLAWLFMTGEWPELEIDHINGVPGDNRWNNLRHVDSSINKENRSVARSDNASGLLGAHFHKKHGWRSSIRVRGKVIHLGYFASADEASSAYLQKKRELHDGCTI